MFTTVFIVFCHFLVNSLVNIFLSARFSLYITLSRFFLVVKWYFLKKNNKKRLTLVYECDKLIYNVP